MKRAILSLFLTMFTATTCPAQTVEQVAKELVRQGVPHSRIVLAQARLETGNFTSRRCKQDHNLFGMKGGKGMKKRNGYAKYSHWRESIADYKERISSRYDGEENYYAFLRRIKYASDERYIDKLRKFNN